MTAASAGRPRPVLPRAGGAGPRALARARRLRPLARRPRGGRGLELLRGPADRQRPARLPPRPRPRLQGHLPALPGDVRLPGAAQGRLGLPRPAGRDRGRKTARHRLQAGDRGVRDRRVQPALPRVGLRVRRGVEPADRADRLLDRPRRPLRDPRGRLHRVGLVVAAGALGQGAPLRGPQGRPLLPALRHGALLARGRARLRGRRGPVHIRENSASPLLHDGEDRYGSAAAPAVGDGVGESLLVWTTTPWTLPGNVAVAVAPEVTYVEGEGRRRDADPRRAAGREGARGGRRDPRPRRRGTSSSAATTRGRSSS